MKRFLLGLAVLGVAAVVAGCPIYSNNGGSYRVCTSTTCYDCPDPTLSGACTPWVCSTSDDCGDGYVCSGDECVSEQGAPADAGPYPTSESCSSPHQCAIGSVCANDGLCHEGSCSTWGCVSGYVCFVSYDDAECVVNDSLGDAGGTPGDAGGDSGIAEAGPSNDSGHVSDARPTGDSGSGDAESTGNAGKGQDSGPGTDGGVSAIDAATTVDGAAGASTGCNDDGTCGGGGARCIDGQCTAQAALCSDGTQCADSESCVDGECTPHCSIDVACPIGFGCDLNRGVCSLNSTVCASNGDCVGGTTCVESHCVAPCPAADSGTTCPSSELCVNGGCIPSQAASFSCKNDGYVGSVANSCDPSSICLHGDCYVNCEIDGGTECASPDVCKNVMTAQGTFAVCGPPAELGSQCDPAAGTYCSPGATCIDGYCK